MQRVIIAVGHRRTPGHTKQALLAQAPRPAGRRLQWIVAGALAAPMLAAGGAQAAAAAGSNAIEELVVTAQKRDEKLSDVPISISVVTPAVLAMTNAKNLTELSGAVPGVQFNGNAGGGRTYVSMRGTTGTASNIGDEPVAIYLDDIYLPRGLTISQTDLLDLGSIEIVRGPQGTLQGRNATAGAILIRSADPTPEAQGYVDLQAQSYGQYRGQAAISGPLGGGFRGRLAIGGVSSRGWGKNLYDDSHIGGGKSGQIRGVVTYADGGRFTARVSADYAVINNEPALFRYATTNFNPLPTGILVVGATQYVPLSPAAKAAVFDREEFNLKPTSRTTLDVGGISARAAYAFDQMDLISVSGYRKTHVFGNNNSSGLNPGARLGDNNNDDVSKGYSEELRLQSSGDHRLNWTTGVYYFYEDQTYADTLRNFRLSVPVPASSLFKGDQSTESYAVFGDATFNLTDQLQLIAGGRYSTDHKKLDAFIRVTNPETGVTTLTPYPGSHSWSDATYRAKVVYHPTEHIMLFLGYGTGFRAGGFNAFAVQPPFKPESLKSLEGGLKGDFFDRRLTASFTAYRNDYHNLQLRAGVPAGGAIITNAANSVINGFELEVQAQPIDRTRLSFSVAHNDATFKSFPRAVDIFNRFVDASGNHLPNAPSWQVFASAAHDFELPSGWTVSPEVNYRWRDTIYFYFTDQTATTLYDGPAGILGARVSVRSPDQKWTLAAFATNLTNKRMVITDTITFSYPEVSLNEPRAFGVSLRREF